MRDAPVRLTLLVDAPPEHPAFASSQAALEHAAEALDVAVDVAVLRTTAWTGDRSALGDGVLIGPGSPYDAPRAAYNVIRTARERGLPLLGT